jgi:hypothetical protein
MYRQYLSDSWLLKQWDWQWLVTFTFSRRVSREMAMGKLKDWLRKLQKEEHMQAGGMYCRAIKGGHTHFHLVLIGSGRRNDREITLKDIDPQKWERAWNPRRVRRGRNRPAEIKVVESSEAASHYLASHNFEWKADDAEINGYNGKLLKRLRKNSLRAFAGECRVGNAIACKKEDQS